MFDCALAGNRCEVIMKVSASNAPTATEHKMNTNPDFAFDANFSRLMVRTENTGWVKAAHFSGHSPRCLVAQIAALTKDGSMSTGRAALLRQQMRDARYTEGAEALLAAYCKRRSVRA